VNANQLDRRPPNQALVNRSDDRKELKSNRKERRMERLSRRKERRERNPEIKLAN